MARVKVRSHVHDAAFRAEMRRLPRRMRRGARNALDDAVSDVGDDMRRNAPVLSGRLRRSIAPDRKPLKAKVGPGREVDEYDQYVEFGTSKMSAQPFIAPAGERARPRFPKTVAKHVRLALRR